MRACTLLLLVALLGRVVGLRRDAEDEGEQEGRDRELGPASGGHGRPPRRRAGPREARPGRILPVFDHRPAFATGIRRTGRPAVTGRYSGTRDAGRGSINTGGQETDRLPEPRRGGRGSPGAEAPGGAA